MANHLTPDELSKELGIDRQEVIRVCIEEGVPIYQGKIDKTLFQAQLQALGAAPGALTYRSSALRRQREGPLRGLLLLARGGLAPRGSLLVRRLLRGRLLRLLGVLDAAAERLHQVDHRRLVDGLRASRSPCRPASPRAACAGRAGSRSGARRGRTRRRGWRSPRGELESGPFTVVS